MHTPKIRCTIPAFFEMTTNPPLIFHVSDTEKTTYFCMISYVIMYAKAKVNNLNDYAENNNDS